MGINKTMLLPKFVYFALYSMVGTFIPFMNGMMTHAGLTPTQAGFISGMRAVFFIPGLLWGILADYTGYRKTLFVLVLIGAMSAWFPVSFVTDNDSCSEYNNTTVFNNSIIIEDEIIISDDCRNKRFNLFMAFIFTASLFDQAVISFIDSLVVNIVSNSQNPNSFGDQRLFGSIGFGATTFVVGAAIDYNNVSALPKYAPAFIIMLAMGLLLLPTAMMLFTKAVWTSKNHEENEFGLIKTLKLIFDNVDRPLFFLSVLIMGIGFGLVNGFLYKFMLDDIKTSNTLAGLSLSLSFTSEFVMFFFAKYFIKYLNGPTNCIAISALSYFVRFLCMSYAYNPWLVIVLQCFHAFGFALFWASAIEKVRSFAPKESLTTVISILAMTHFGLGNLVANIAGGYVYDKYNGRILFRYVSILFSFLGCSLLVYNYSYNRFQSFKAQRNKELKGIPSYKKGDSIDNKV